MFLLVCPLSPDTGSVATMHGGRKLVLLDLKLPPTAAVAHGGSGATLRSLPSRSSTTTVGEVSPFDHLRSSSGGALTGEGRHPQTRPPAYGGSCASSFRVWPRGPCIAGVRRWWRVVMVRSSSSSPQISQLSSGPTL
jgi:hypothetical protein